MLLAVNVLVLHHAVAGLLAPGTQVLTGGGGVPNPAPKAPPGLSGPVNTVLA